MLDSSQVGRGGEPQLPARLHPSCGGSVVGNRFTKDEAVASFWAKVRKSDLCWEWVGALDSCGYGMVRNNLKSRKAHRVSYEWLVGPVPDGLEIDHLCRNRACVRPDHLEAVTHLENMSRGDAGKYLAVRERCNAGHPFDKENTYIRADGGGRACRACRMNDMRRSRGRRPKSECACGCRMFAKNPGSQYIRGHNRRIKRG